MKLARRPVSVVAACALGLGVAACSGSAGTSPHSSAAAVLTMESTPSGPISRDFNPFSATSADNTLGSTTLTYEPLYQWDLAKTNTMYPWLATSYAWSNGGKTITFTIRGGVKWSNGQPFTAADVAFTFNLLKKYPAINTSGLGITGASAPTATTAVVSFSQPSYTDLYYITGTYVVPESQWSKVGNPATYTDPDPIGTGPYLLSSFSANGLTYTKNPHYWQPGLPEVDTVDFPVYASNTSANLALEDGSLDWAGNFVSNIKSNYLDKNPAVNHLWDPPATTTTFTPNLTKFPFNSLAVRQAVSEGIDRTVIAAEGEDNQSPPAIESGALTGLVLPLQNSYLSSQTRSYNTTYSTSACKATLEKAGWKMGSNGYFRSPSGQTLAFTLLDPSSFTDFITDDQIMASELQGCGMDVTAQSDSIAAWSDALSDGNFQATTYWGTPGPTPYYQYNSDLNDTLAPAGRTASGDYERFYSPQAQSYLSSYAGSNNPATQQADIVGLETIVATQLPVIPMVYGTDEAEYSTSDFTGWPSPANPYETGQPEQPTDEVTLLHLKPVS